MDSIEQQANINMYNNNNRYAHLISNISATNSSRATTQMMQYQHNPNQPNQNLPATTTMIANNSNNNPINPNGNHQAQMRSKPPPLSHHDINSGVGGAPKYAFYNSFSANDLSGQWQIMKSKLLEKVEEPTNQRRLIMIIVCCALLLDNMLYMVIVPIIPDYLRKIGAWSTYTRDGKWIMRRNHTDAPMKWERVSGEVVYEGEDSAVGFLFASKAIVQLFINPFSGHIIDRIGYEIPMMIGLVVMFFSTMVFACGQTYSVLFLARSLQGVGSAFADTAGLAMIADRFTEENERQRALGVALAFISFGCLVAPPFGSVLYQAAGKEVPFIILSLICLIDGSLLLLVTPPGTFSQLLPGYRPPADQQSTIKQQQQTTTTVAVRQQAPRVDSSGNSSVDSEAAATPANKQSKLQRQKSVSRRQSLTVASAGEAPKGTPIYVLFRDPHIACCAGALVMANVSLAFLEPTISIWMENTMKDMDEWQLGVIWLPAFFPHILGVYTTVKLADKYPKYQWLIAAIGLVLEGLSCLMVPFCTSFWSLIIPISIICFGVAQIDTAILPLLGYLVDTRYVSVYGSIYAIADISYSLSYAIGPIIAGGIVEAIGFTALNILIAVVTLGYVPALAMLRSVHDYEPFDADTTGLRKSKEAPFGQFGRKPLASDDSQTPHHNSIQNNNNHTIDDDFGQFDDQYDDSEPASPLQLTMSGQQQQQNASQISNYGRPAWAAPDYQQTTGPSGASQEQLKSVLARKQGGTGSIKMETRKQHSVKIVDQANHERDGSFD